MSLAVLVSRPDAPLKPAVGMTAAMQAIGASDTPPTSPDKHSSGYTEQLTLRCYIINGFTSLELGSP